MNAFARLFSWLRGDHVQWTPDEEARRTTEATERNLRRLEAIKRERDAVQRPWQYRRRPHG